MSENNLSVNLLNTWPTHVYARPDLFDRKKCRLKLAHDRFKGPDRAFASHIRKPTSAIDLTVLLVKYLCVFSLYV